MSTENTTIIEVAGKKIEINLDKARIVDEYHIGDTVKVLKKNYGDNYSVFPGVIVSLDNFKELPTLTIMYFEVSYDKAVVNFAHINKKTESVDIAPMSKEEICFEHVDVMQIFERSIEKKKMEIREVEAQRNYFLAHFGHLVELKDKAEVSA